MQKFLLAVAAIALSASAGASANANRTVEVRELIQTDVYSSESVARSMLNSLVGNRLARECQNRYNSSLLWDTIEYRIYFDGTTGQGRYRASTNQAWANCR